MGGQAFLSQLSIDFDLKLNLLRCYIYSNLPSHSPSIVSFVYHVVVFHHLFLPLPIEWYDVVLIFWHVQTISVSLSRSSFPVVALSLLVGYHHSSFFLVLWSRQLFADVSSPQLPIASLEFPSQVMSQRHITFAGLTIVRYTWLFKLIGIFLSYITPDTLFHAFPPPCSLNQISLSNSPFSFTWPATQVFKFSDLLQSFTFNMDVKCWHIYLSRHYHHFGLTLTHLHAMPFQEVESIFHCLLQVLLICCSHSNVVSL